MREIHEIRAKIYEEQKMLSDSEKLSVIRRESEAAKMAGMASSRNASSNTHA